MVAVHLPDAEKIAMQDRHSGTRSPEPDAHLTAKLQFTAVHEHQYNTSPTYCYHVSGSKHGAMNIGYYLGIDYRYLMPGFPGLEVLGK